MMSDLTATAAGKPSRLGWIDRAMPDQRVREQFQTHGFVVLPDALSAGEVEELRGETTAICRGERGLDDGIVRDLHASESEVLSRYLCIHQVHKLSPVMLGYLAHPQMTAVLTSCIGPNVKCMQSMLFIKAAGKPGQAWHQDELYIPTRDRSLMGGWIALDDATVQNGCLRVIPGSHARGILWPQQPSTQDEFDCAAESYGFPYTTADEVAVEVPAGSIVFFSGYLLHRSLRNRSAVGARRCLVNHYCSAETLLPWGRPRAGDPSVGQLDYRDIVMVAGEDPYAWKGTEQRAKPHVRPTGDGGCGR